jgi:hypothetical protein
MPAQPTQTPWLGGTRPNAWRRLTTRGWPHAGLDLALAAADAVAAALRLPWRGAALPIAAPRGTRALLQLRPKELMAHAAALSLVAHSTQGSQVRGGARPSSTPSVLTCRCVSNPVHPGHVEGSARGALHPRGPNGCAMHEDGIPTSTPVGSSAPPPRPRPRPAPVPRLQAPAPSVRAGGLLHHLAWGDPLPDLLPRLNVHAAFYGALDSDAAPSAYAALSKEANYASFHIARCGRYGLLSGNNTHLGGPPRALSSAAAPVAVAGGGAKAAGGEVAKERPVATEAADGPFESTVLDQALLLSVLLGDYDVGLGLGGALAQTEGDAEGEQDEEELRRRREEELWGSEEEEGEAAVAAPGSKVAGNQQPGARRPTVAAGSGDGGSGSHEANDTCKSDSSSQQGACPAPGVAAGAEAAGGQSDGKGGPEGEWEVGRGRAFDVDAIEARVRAALMTLDRAVPLSTG